jgi:hypothetical protein
VIRGRILCTRLLVAPASAEVLIVNDETNFGTGVAILGESTRTLAWVGPKPISRPLRSRREGAGGEGIGQDTRDLLVRRFIAEYSSLDAMSSLLRLCPSLALVGSNQRQISRSRSSTGLKRVFFHRAQLPTLRSN